MSNIPSFDHPAGVPLPHAPENCEEYSPADCIEYHQKNLAYLKAKDELAKRLAKDIHADYKEVNAIFEKVRTAGRDDALKNIKEASESLAEWIALAKKVKEELMKERRDYAAKYGRFLPDFEDDDLGKRSRGDQIV
ncbi:hypothetical protein MMC34_000850 [Xylographa carneopallida]|nr:hypothetical protein [Xylographa carneopallida]